MERLIERQPDFTLTDQNAALLGDVCRRLDGLPLALQLAAARIRTLTLDEIVAGLEDRFVLLRHGRRDARPQHATMEAALEWSYTLLSEQARHLFQTLAVFPGGGTQEAIAAICHPGEGTPGQTQALLAQLIDHSLVFPEGRGETLRYRMLDTMREYSYSKLQALGDREAVHGRQAAYYHDQGALLKRSWTQAPQEVWTAWYLAEQANLRGALTWLAETAEGARPGLRLATALGRLWNRCGHYREGAEWLLRLLHLSRETALPEERAEALHQLSILEWRLGEYAPAHTHAQEALALFACAGATQNALDARFHLANLAMEQGEYAEADKGFEACRAEFAAREDAIGLAKCLDNLAAVAMARGEFARADTLYQEALTRQEAAGQKDSQADILNNLGSLAWMQGDLETAQARYQEALERYRGLQHEQGIASVLTNLGAVCFSRGGHEQALAYYEEALRRVRISGEQRTLLVLLNNLGEVYSLQAQHPVAESYFAEGLALGYRTGHKQVVVECLDGLAWVYACTKRSDQAACLFAAVARLRHEFTFLLTEADQFRRDTRVADVHTQLGQERVEKQRQIGEQMALEKVVQYCQQHASAKVISAMKPSAPSR